MITLDTFTVSDLLIKALEARGFEYVYERQDGPQSCLYVHNTLKSEDGMLVDNDPEEWEPGCIVGFVLKGAGVSLETLKEYEGQEARTLLRNLEENGILTCDDEVSVLLSRVQGQQDEGTPWGVAVIKSLASVFESALQRGRNLKADGERKSAALAKVRESITGVY